MDEDCDINLISFIYLFILCVNMEMPVKANVSYCSNKNIRRLRSPRKHTEQICLEICLEECGGWGRKIGYSGLLRGLNRSLFQTGIWEEAEKSQTGICSLRETAKKLFPSYHFFRVLSQFVQDWRISWDLVFSLLKSGKSQTNWDSWSLQVQDMKVADKIKSGNWEG